MEVTTSTAQGGSGFVGRDRELNELVAMLDAAGAGSGRLVLIGGEPGVGKSRLADELTSRARERGYEVLWGRAWEDAGAPPYWPWIQVLRTHIRAAGPAEIRQQLGAGIADVAQMLPDLRQLFPDVPPPPATESESARFQLFDSTTTFIRNAALSRPLLIVLDDMHSADTPSLLMIRFLATQLGDIRALLVCTYRDVEVTPEHPLASALPGLAREPTTRLMPLRGLPVSAVAEVIGSAAGVTPPPHLVSAVWRETKGNPLFVGEAVRLLSVEGRLDETADLSSLRVAVPAGIREVISRRIGHLPQETVGAMAIGAALGPEFSLDVLRRVGEFEVDHLLDLLDPAVNAGLLLSVTGGVVRYRFSHDLVRETLYDGLAPGRRVRLHRRIADVLEQLAGGMPDPYLAELAFHFFQAAQGTDGGREAGPDPADRAIDYARRAGEQASRSLAYEEAARLFRMALAVLELADTPDEVVRTETLLRLGDVEARAGELQTSRVTFREAARIARQIGEARQLARAALGYSGRLPWVRPGGDTSVIPLLQDALDVLGGADDRLRVRLLTRLACVWRSSPDKREQCAALSQQAVDLARSLGDPGTLSYALAGRFWATWWPENPPTERLAIAEEMVTVAESAGDAERLIDAYLMQYLAYAEIPRMADAKKAEEEVRRLANELRQPAQLWLGVAPRALMALMKGDYPLAEKLIARELEWDHPMNPAGDDVSAGRSHLYLLRREQGRAAESEGGIRAAVEEFPWYPLHRAALVNLLLDQDRAAEARAAFDDLARDEFGALYRDNEWLLGIALAAEACARLSDEPSARVLYTQLLPFAGRHAVGQPEGSLGAADRYLGLLAATKGDVPAAERHLTDAIHISEQMGARPWTAHAQHDLGQVLMKRGAEGDRERAATLLKEALLTARTLGMTALERQVLAAGAEDVPAARAETPMEASEALFQRDGDVWAIGRERVFRLRDSKGLRYLATLLAHPGREFHVLELISGGASSPAPQASRAQATELGLRPEGDGGGEILDAEAKAAYRARLRELQAEVDEGDASADPVRADRARAEIDALTAELSAAFGLGGRARPEGSAAERARQSVAKALRDALRRIHAQDSAIGDHLLRSVRTGLYCAYDPDPSAVVLWRTHSARE